MIRVIVLGRLFSRPTIWDESAEVTLLLNGRMMHEVKDEIP